MCCGDVTSCPGLGGVRSETISTPCSVPYLTQKRWCRLRIVEYVLVCSNSTDGSAIASWGKTWLPKEFFLFGDFTPHEYVTHCGRDGYV